jgi:hypothetical protein
MTGVLTMNIDGGAIRIKPKTAAYGNYIWSVDSDDANLWRVGTGAVGSYDVEFSNYKGGNNSVTLGADGSIVIGATNSKNVNITGQAIPSNYANFDARYIQNVRVGAVGTITVNKDSWSEAPVGSFMTGWYYEGDNPGGDSIHYRPIQIYINGGWKTITS